MRRPENRPSPSPRIDAHSDFDYDAACDRWARKLTEKTLRELTYDYLRGNREEHAIDAHAEFIRRESLGLLSDQVSESSILRAKKAKSRNDAQRKSRRSRD